MKSKCLKSSVTLVLSWTLALCPVIPGGEVYAAAEAIQALMQQVNEEPGKAEGHFQLGNAYYEDGQLKAAIGAYKEAVRLDPDFANAHFNLGLALMAECDYVEANEHFTQTLRLDPNNTQALMNMDIMQQLPGDDLDEKGDLCRVLQIIKLLKPLQDVLKLQKTLTRLPDIPREIPKNYREITELTRIRKAINVPKRVKTY